MSNLDLEQYNSVRENGIGFYEQKRGLIEVSGGEAIQFLNGLVSNDVAKMNSAVWISAAFPNAQGRLLALSRVMRFRFFSLEKDYFKDDKFIFETEAGVYEKVLQNLARFTMAGDFYVRDLTEDYTCISLRGNAFKNPPFSAEGDNSVKVARDIDEERSFYVRSLRGAGLDFFVPQDKREDFIGKWKKQGAVEIGDVAREVLRIEDGLPLYGVDMDETTIVPEIGLPDVISYTKGCYIGQEIIARIHFRGHIAKQLTGLVFSEPEAVATGLIGQELKSPDGKNAGKITSAVFSPKLEKQIALGFVRYDYLAEGTELKVGELTATVKNLPFIE